MVAPNHETHSPMPPDALFATQFNGIADKNVVTVVFKDDQRGTEVTVGIPRVIAEQLALHVLTTHYVQEPLAFRYHKLFACKLA